MQKKTIFISGMHCTSCEKLLEDEFKNIEGVESVRADRKKNLVEIYFKATEPDFSQFKIIAEKFGYQALESKEGNTILTQGGHWTDWAKAIMIVFLMLIIFRIFLNLGIADKINPQNSGVSYFLDFLVGIVASVSSCLAIVGSVIIAFSEKYKTDDSSFLGGTLKPNLFFQIGRLVTFFVLGGLLGLIGGEINITGNFVSIYTLIIAFVMFWLSLNILGFLPSITNLGVRMPKRITNSWSNLRESNHKMAPFLLGAFSFFLPCGFTQSMQILALTSGSFLKGSLTLFLFALGTVPVLLVLGAAVSWTKTKKMVVFQKVAGILILIFALYTFNSGWALSGVKNNVISSKNGNSAQSSNFKEGPKNDDTNAQVVEMHITSAGFEPNVLKVKVGVPVKWIINGDSVSGCTNKIIVPSLNIEKNIVSGQNIISFTPTKSGEITFSCWMGMVRGKFIVQ